MLGQPSHTNCLLHSGTHLYHKSCLLCISISDIAITTQNLFWDMFNIFNGALTVRFFISRQIWWKFDGFSRVAWSVDNLKYSLKRCLKGFFNWNEKKNDKIFHHILFPSEVSTYWSKNSQNCSLIAQIYNHCNCLLHWVYAMIAYFFTHITKEYSTAKCYRSAKFQHSKTSSHTSSSCLVPHTTSRF